MKEKELTLSGYLTDDETVAVIDAATEARDVLTRLLKPGMSVDVFIRADGSPALGRIVFSIRGSVV